ncbi:NAD-dependent epimerase/dehydratase family protein [Bradyrhizobium liaoningense]|nr:NAD-dependent epimerase/dehydratase family protein [Bradyrhizobium liaoningense]
MFNRCRSPSRFAGLIIVMSYTIGPAGGTAFTNGPSAQDIEARLASYGFDQHTISVEIHVQAREPSGAKSVVVWGTSKRRREFLYLDEMGDACVHLMKNSVNVGTGDHITIAEFARVVAEIVGYRGERPDGTPRGLLDVRRRAPTSVENGTKLTYLLGVSALDESKSNQLQFSEMTKAGLLRENGPAACRSCRT